MKRSDIHRVKPEDIKRQKLIFRYHNVMVSDYLVYLTLKALFGAADSVQINGDTEWIYALRVPNAYLSITAWEKRRIDGGLTIYPDEDDTNKAYGIAREFLELLMFESKRHSSKIRGKIKEAEARKFQNPFAEYFSDAQLLLKKAKEPKSNLTLLDYQEMYANLRAAFFLFVASFEGLLNLIYELNLKPSLRDERIYQRLAREQIDIKLRLAPLYCDCFQSDHFDFHSDAFDRFLYIVELRNNIIHANITLPMRTSILVEDEFWFLQKEAENEGKYGLSQHIYFEFKDLDFVEKSIRDITELLIQAMKPNYQADFRKILHQLEVFVIWENDRYKIALPDS